VLTEIAQKAFAFEMLIAIFSTIIALSMIGGGVPIPPTLEPLFLPSTKIYNMTKDIVQSLPQEPSTNPLVWAKVAGAVMGALLQFLWTLATGFITLTIIIAHLLPPPFIPFSAAIIAMGGFLQFCTWYYMVNKFLQIVGQYIGISIGGI